MERGFYVRRGLAYWFVNDWCGWSGGEESCNMLHFEKVLIVNEALQDA